MHTSLRDDRECLAPNSSYNRMYRSSRGAAMMLLLDTEILNGKCNWRRRSCNYRCSYRFTPELVRIVVKGVRMLRRSHIYRDASEFVHSHTSATIQQVIALSALDAFITLKCNIHMKMCRHTYIHTYIHTYMHTYIHYPNLNSSIVGG